MKKFRTSRDGTLQAPVVWLLMLGTAFLADLPALLFLSVCPSVRPTPDHPPAFLFASSLSSSLA
jgi:hypothetical protein